jgi:hypothetical protein
MVKFLPVLLLALMAPSLYAQSDTGYYRITMNDGSSFDCKVLELKKGESIKVMKVDSSFVTLSWDGFKNYQSIAQLKDVEAAKHKEKEAKHHKAPQANEVSTGCLVIKMNGDTLHGVIIADLKDVFIKIKMSNNEVVEMAYSEVKDIIYETSNLHTGSKNLWSLRSIEHSRKLGIGLTSLGAVLTSVGTTLIIFRPVITAPYATTSSLGPDALSFGLLGVGIAFDVFGVPTIIFGALKLHKADRQLQVASPHRIF